MTTPRRGRRRRTELLADADWSMTDRQIAKETGVRTEDVAAERVWRSVDWDFNDTEIATETGFTRQAVARQRKNRSKPPPAIVLPDEPGPGATFRQIIGWRVALHRSWLELSMEELADSVSELSGSRHQASYVWAVQNGHASKRHGGVTVESLDAFAQALEVTPADLGAAPDKHEFKERPWSKPFPEGPLRWVIGQNVKLWRQALELSPRELGLEVGVRWNATDVSNVEAGVRVPKGPRNIGIDTIPDFARALEVDPIDLLRLPAQAKLWTP